jgi:hypothetical protein
MEAVIADLSFIADDARYEQEKPYDIIFADPSEPRKSNCIFQSVDAINIVDCRPHFHDFDLQQHGFQFLRHPSQVPIQLLMSPNEDSKALIEQYLSETISLVREKFKAKLVVCFDWRV